MAEHGLRELELECVAQIRAPEDLRTPTTGAAVPAGRSNSIAAEASWTTIRRPLASSSDDLLPVTLRRGGRTIDLKPKDE